MKRNSTRPHPCPCGSGLAYTLCCRPLHAGQPASTALALMRSRYSAYALQLHDYLQATWHSSTRPASLDAETGAPPLKWTSLQVHSSRIEDENHAIVEFTARYRRQGRAGLMHEISRFVREHDHWYYLEALNSDADAEDQAD